jgi:hypothetical protein
MGQVGLFVVPTDSLAAAPVFVSSGPTKVLGRAPGALASGDAAPPTAELSNLLMVAATGSDGNLHIFDIDLTGSAVPTLAQAGSLSVASAALCSDSGSGFADASVPTSLYVLLHITSGVCGSAGDTWEVVHYGDSATTSPTVVGISTTSILSLYQPTGSLGGIAAVDSNSNLVLYPDSTFTSPRILVAGLFSTQTALSMLAYQDSEASAGGQPGFAFLAARLSSGTVMYRLDASGNLVNVYTNSGAQAGGYGPSAATPDGQNFIFTAYQACDFPGCNATIIQVTQCGTNPTVLASPFLSAEGEPVASIELLGSNNSALLFALYSANEPPFFSTQLMSIPLGAPGTPTTLLNYPGYAQTVLAPLSGSWNTAALFVNLLPQGPGPVSNEVLSLDGSTLQPVVANALWSTSTTQAGAPIPTTLLEFTGITDVSSAAQNPTMGGATVNAVNLASITSTIQSTPLLGPGSTPFVIPSGCSMQLAADYPNAIVSGTLACASPFLDGVAADLGNSEIVAPIVVANSGVAPAGIRRTGRRPAADQAREPREH